MTNPITPSTCLIACASGLQLLFLSCVEVDVTQAKDVARGKRVLGDVAAICEVSETDGTLINISKICKTLVNGSLGASDG